LTLLIFFPSCYFSMIFLYLALMTYIYLFSFLFIFFLRRRMQMIFTFYFVSLRICTFTLNGMHMYDWWVLSKTYFVFLLLAIYIIYIYRLVINIVNILPIFSRFLEVTTGSSLHTFCWKKKIEKKIKSSSWT